MTILGYLTERRTRLIHCALLSFSIFYFPPSFAEVPEFAGARRGFATVMLAGLAGAVLGLSTLSFYGKPEEHIGNIYVGLGLGLLGGAGYVLAVPENERSWSRDEFSNPEKFEIRAAGISQTTGISSACPGVLRWSWEIP
ncbi:MAG: hypothetical protein C5B49_03220 [Bdellovibrio sp.]|nr:MAG: hypothetical protein C5B49_03220 [Bdellovibrio sp.]